MSLYFTKGYKELKELLSSLGGEWDDSQTNKKVFRLNKGIMNWYESTGTIQFQGKEGPKKILEGKVSALLYPGEYQENRKAQIEFEDEQREQVIEEFQPESDIAVNYLNGAYEDSELVIGIVSSVGTESTRVVTPLSDRLKGFGYHVEHIRVSSLLKSGEYESEYERIKDLMKEGDKLREKTKNNAILAYGAAKLIKSKRDSSKNKRTYIINSLKHPDEVEILRKIYGQGFYLFGIHADRKRRLSYLIDDKDISNEEASELTDIDEDEKIPHGQRTRDTFHLSDFFINFGKNDDQVKNTIQRFLELIFSHPFKNPTFDEFSMFMACSSSVRSGDLSRQVGAVITKHKQIIATGANECPASGGGQYWAEIDEQSGEVVDKRDGKDYKRNEDSNKIEQNEIIHGIVSMVLKIEGIDESKEDEVQEALEKSRIRDITEYGRVVHAEMEALLSCAREGINCTGAELYSTTFPCHNCAKHIVAAGIKRVVYVEPYPKSKALELHSDSIQLVTIPEENGENTNVIFEPFTGVGARRFLDIFSMNLGNGNKLKRKNIDGTTVEWDKNKAIPRVALLPKSYLEIEESAAKLFE